MRASVKVAGLSVQKTSMLPRFCIAAKRLTITLLAACAARPATASRETTMGRSSGVSPHARATAKQKRFKQGVERKALTRRNEQDKQNGHPHDEEPETAGPLLKGGGRGLARRVSDLTEFRVLPGAAHFITLAVPLITDFPKERYCRPRGYRALPGNSPGVFSTGNGSPVRALVDEEVLCLQHPASQGTKSPAARNGLNVTGTISARSIPGACLPAYLTAYRPPPGADVPAACPPRVLHEIEVTLTMTNGADT